MKKIICLILVLIIISTTGCSSLSRGLTDIKSDLNGGLERDIRVMTADGKIIKEFHGKIDIESENSYIKFDFEGKRYIYYNCFVESIGEIE